MNLKMSYYYWDDNHRNELGESLSECMEKYGTKVQIMKNGREAYKYKVIFLDKRKTLAHSWMLWYKDRNGRNIKVRLYENPDCIQQGTI